MRILAAAAGVLGIVNGMSRDRLAARAREWWPLVRLLLFVCAMWLALGWPAWALGAYSIVLLVGSAIAWSAGRLRRSRRQRSGSAAGR